MSNSLKIVLIIVLVLIIGGGIYYLSQLSPRESPPPSDENGKTPLPPVSEMSEEEFDKMNPDSVAGTIKVETVERGGQFFKRFSLLTEDEITYYLTPANEEFYNEREIGDGDKVEIQGKIEPRGNSSKLFIGRITKK